MRIISLGAGVQSTTLYLMSVNGDIPRADAAIFADTGWEPAGVYRHLEWLEDRFHAEIPITRVSVGNIREDTLAGRLPRAGVQYGRAFMTMPVYVAATEQYAKTILRRQCTQEYKLAPIRRWIREQTRETVNLFIGISLDECHRMRDSRLKYIRHEYPLIDCRMTRHDCLRWLTAHEYPIPPKSSCIGCPFHSDGWWRALRQDNPAEWQDAVAFDRAIRSLPRIKGDAFLHRSLKPLDEVDLSNDADRGQLDLFGNECEGMCGV